MLVGDVGRITLYSKFSHTFTLLSRSLCPVDRAALYQTGSDTLSIGPTGPMSAETEDDGLLEPNLTAFLVFKIITPWRNSGRISLWWEWLRVVSFWNFFHIPTILDWGVGLYDH